MRTEEEGAFFLSLQGLEEEAMPRMLPVQDNIRDSKDKECAV